MALAIKFQQMIDRGEVKDYADFAPLGFVTRARVTQIMNLTLLATSPCLAHPPARRVLRLMREHQLLAPQRQPQPVEPKRHEGTILAELRVPDDVNIRSDDVNNDSGRM